MVKSIEELAPQLEIQTLFEPDFFDDAQIKASEPRTADIDTLRSALAVINFDTAGTVGRRKVTTTGWAVRSVAGKGGCACAKRLFRVLNDLLRQEVCFPICIIKSQFVCILQLFHCHTNQLNIGEHIVAQLEIAEIE